MTLEETEFNGPGSVTEFSSISLSCKYIYFCRWKPKNTGPRSFLLTSINICYISELLELKLNTHASLPADGQDGLKWIAT